MSMIKRHVPGLMMSIAVFAALAMPSCSDDFAPASEITALRIISIEADKPYAAPGDRVQITMTAFNALSTATESDPVTVSWITGCSNPDGGYLGCIPALSAALSGQGGDGTVVQQMVLASTGEVGNASVQVILPDDLVSTASNEAGQIRQGKEYVFFAVCAGELRLVEPEPGDLPLACFDSAGNRLGAEAFVPGFTVISAFEDGRSNENPTVDDITFDGSSIGETAEDDDIPTAAACSAPQDEEGCGAEESTCAVYSIAALIDDVAEVDPSLSSVDGATQREIVWVDYYATDGTLDPQRRLVSDADDGYQSDFSVEWTPPSTTGLVRIWAVAHDSRGGAQTRTGLVRVE